MAKLIKLLTRIVKGELTGRDAADALESCEQFHELGGAVICDGEGRPESVSINIPRRLG